MLLLILVWIGVSACTGTTNPIPRVTFGPQANASLLVFFKADATNQEIIEFWETVISRPVPPRGNSLLPGIGGVFSSRVVQGHESIVITFRPTATEAQRLDVKARVLASPIVFKVLENVVPAQVDTIE